MLRREPWAIALCALFSWSCAKTTQPDDFGTNTNWLQTCEETADCDGGDECLCGVCTQSCSGSAQCENDATQCEETTAAACGGGVSVTTACLQGCGSNADCTAVEDGRCIEGLCVPATRVPDANVPDAEIPLDGGNLPIDRFAVSRSGSLLLISSGYLDCTDHSQCVLVTSDCDGCCRQSAINDEHQELFAQNSEVACADYTGGICDCGLEPLFPACREDQCTALHQVDDCFSPTQNLDLAYVPGAVGCACEPRDTASTVTQICLGREALYCTPLPDGSRWIAVEDGPCGEPEPDPTCADGELRPTPTACIEDFEICYVLPNGEYCGRNP